ncbi:MAG: copper chaperone PCu(A)C, partial [Alphaproteobacteria bacterium]|nr:copper chaperone PCu(A)C [Alphaproteobacteria bacterium]
MRNAKLIAVVAVAGVLALGAGWYLWAEGRVTVSGPEPVPPATANPPGAVALVEPFSYPPPPGAANGAIYFTLTNSGAERVLVGARTSLDGSASLHESGSSNGIASMKALGSVVVPAGGT